MTDALRHAPVIVGVAEITDKPDDPRLGKEPLQLMAEALRRADHDAGGGWLPRIESLDVVNSMTWGYDDLPRELCAVIGAQPGRAVYGEVGGDTPIRYLHDAAIRIAAGELEVAAICGAEAAQTLERAERAGVALPWTPEGPKPQRPKREGVIHASALKNGLNKPLFVYPIYEYGARAAWGQSFAEGQAESAELWSRFSAVAARNPNAWLPRFFSPEEIATPSKENRFVAGPYTKRMVALPAVNQGSAILVTSYGRARAAGIPDGRVVFLWGGGAAMEPRDFAARDQYHHSCAMDAVLAAAHAIAAENAADFDLVELYSCFPCVPKMARRSMGLAADRVPTVAGSLTFFGAPLNNYMTHATAAMTRAIREGQGAAGLLYGQGGFVTKHHTMAAGRRPPATPIAPGYNVQAQADARRGPAPPMEEGFEGLARVETFTVIHDRDGEAAFGVVFARTAAGSRVLARVGREDVDTLAFLTNTRQSVAGTTGTVRRGAEDRMHWAL